MMVIRSSIKDGGFGEYGEYVEYNENYMVMMASIEDLPLITRCVASYMCVCKALSTYFEFGEYIYMVNLVNMLTVN